ncbi:MAG: polysaccharide biosynthesis/export family protein [Fimbriimonadaceae bacterium]
MINDVLNWSQQISMDGTMFRNLKQLVLTGAMLAILMGCLAPMGGAQVSPVMYRLKPHDVISISVYNESQINRIVQEITPDGRISAPYGKIIEVAGKTTDEIQAELVEIYKTVLHLKDPKVAVLIERYSPVRASVSGQVFNPGTFDDFRPSDDLFMLLSRGGGVNLNQKANLKRAMLTRRSSGEVIPIDLDALLHKGDTSQNYKLEDGDSLFVPQIEEPFVKIQGAVQRPGVYEYPAVGKYRLSDIISVAGGGIRTLTKFSDVLIIRRSPLNPTAPLFMKANYVRLIRNHDYTQDIELKPGDLVYVSETKTPDPAQLGQILNTVFFIDRFFTGGLFGFNF